MKASNIFWGVFFILAAIAVILNQLGLLAGISLINLTITIFMIPIIITSIKHINFSGILIPLAIIAVTFTFMNWTPIISIGMIMFWGLVIFAIYNLIFTRTLLLNSNKE